jgi:integrase
MSVYKRPAKSPFYYYEFQLNGQRFSGSTGYRGKPEARQVERQRRAEAEAALRAQSRSHSAPLTVDLAAERLWIERGQHYRGNAQKTFKAALAWLVRELGPNRLLTEISNGLVAELVALRRGGGVSNATANRTVTEPLRRLLLRAESAWEQQVPKINWTVHLLPEPAERVRELSADEEARILPELAPDYRDVVLFSLISGCRLGECVNLRWPDVDWGNREITIRGKGTGGAPKVEKIPLTGAMRELLWPRRAHHREWVFTYPTREGRVHLTYEGMKSAWRRAIERAGVEDFRFHDNRHTAATRLLRSGANLKVVQKLLRHSEIATTSKYAHVTTEDVRQAMERAADAFLPGDGSRASRA